MLDWFKEQFDRLPVKVKVFLMGLGGAAGAAAADAAIDGLYSIFMGEVAPTRDSFQHVFGAALGAALFAARAYTAQSPMPRRAWTWAERQAELAKKNAEKGQ